MPQLDQIRRLLLLDELLSRPPRPNKQQILKAFDQNHLSFSKNTLDRDLRSLRTDYGADIYIDAEYRYAYASGSYFVLRQMLADHPQVGRAISLAALNHPSPLISMPFIEVLKRLSEEEEGMVTTPADELEGVLLDDDRYIELTSLRNQLFGAIRDKKMVYFRYAKFGSRREFGLRFHPYLLREYQGRWYVLGDKEQGSQFLQRIYGLERIVNLEVLDDEARLPENNPRDYFRDIIGVSRPAYREVEEIHLAADRKTADYLRSQPWHNSQQEIRTEGNWTEFSFQLVPNSELETLILAQGAGIRVMQPETLRARMREIGEELRKTYE